MSEDVFIKTLTSSIFSNIIINKVGHTKEYQHIDYIVRHDHCIQFVTKGKGKLRVNDKVYPLKQYDLFLIPKSCDHSYESDINDPYDNYWIHFNDSLGTRNFLESINLTKDNPVIRVENDNLVHIFEKIIEISSRYKKADQLILYSKGYELLYEISKTVNTFNNEENKDSLEKAIKYMQENYMNKITLDILSEISCLSKSYFIASFKKKYNKSPIQYLVEYRIGIARQLLISNDSVTDVCFLCGFNDYSDFSTRFKKAVGFSPLKYKQSLSPEETSSN